MSGENTRTTEQKIVIDGLVLPCRIGWGDRERAETQPLRFDVEIAVTPQRPLNEDLAQTVDYSGLVGRIRSLCEAQPFKLLETLAEQVADLCFVDPRVRSARIRVTKPERYQESEGIGIEILRQSN